MVEINNQKEIIGNFIRSYKRSDYKTKVMMRAAFNDLSYTKAARIVSQKVGTRFGIYTGIVSSGLTLFLTHSLLRTSEVTGIVAITVGTGVYFLSKHLLRR
jgi:hypothetical protein